MKTSFRAACAALACSVAPARAAVIIPPTSDATRLTVTLPNGTATNIPAALSRVQGARIWRPAGIRGTYPAEGLSDGKRPCATFREMFNLATRAPVVELKERYANFGGNAGSGQEADGPNNLTITASLEVKPTQPTGVWYTNDGARVLIPFSFGGQTSGTIAKGGNTLETDGLPVGLAPGQTYYVDTRVCADGTGQYPVNWGVHSFNGETANNGLFVQAYAVATATTAPAFTVAPTSNTGASLLPLAGALAAIQVTGPGITGTMTDNGSGTLAAAGSCASGTINYATGAVALSCAAAQSGTYVVQGYDAANGADDTLVANPSDMSSAYQNAYGPSESLALLAPSIGLAPYGALVVGDSIAQYVGNSDALGWLDYCAMGTANTMASAAFGLAKVPQHSETAASFANPALRYRRLREVRGEFDRVLYEYGANDLEASGQTLAVMEANALANWAALGAYLPQGTKGIWATALLPHTSGANVPSAHAGSGASFRNGYNAWLYTKLADGTIGGVIDPNAAVENNPASQAGNGDGLWKSLTYTADGVHPTNTGDLAICAVVGRYGTAPSPAFGAPY